MARVNLYYHGGSQNHGCEAIIRATLKVFNNQKLEVFSMYPQEDIDYGLDKICDLKYDKETPIKSKSLQYYISAVDQKFFHSTKKNSYYRWHTFFDSIQKGDVYLCTGGDNYCYDGTYKLADFNTLIHDKGGKTVLWGCSVEPERLSEAVIKDLKQYDLITVRETLSQEGLYKAGIVDNVKLYSDPAFQLDKVELPLPDAFIEGNTIGINVSPLVIKSANDDNIVLNNYIELMKYILNNTNMNIALIPHVIKDTMDDREATQVLFNMFKNTNRVCVIDDHTCEELKGYISRCRMFVGARTHATIAAYSTEVPTLVVGYSIKAKGIAKDIFGTYDNYVIPVQSLQDEQDLTNAFKWMQNNEESIKNHLHDFMPAYKAKALDAEDKVKELFK